MIFTRLKGSQLRACQSLGWERIDAREVGDLSNVELRLLELEENIRRKNLTPYEKNKAMMEYVEAVKEEEPELRSESEHIARGRPKDSTSMRSVSDSAMCGAMRATMCGAMRATLCGPVCAALCGPICATISSALSS